MVNSLQLHKQLISAECNLQSNINVTQPPTSCRPVWLSLSRLGRP